MTTNFDEYIAGDDDERFKHNCDTPQAGDFVVQVSGAGFIALSDTMDWRSGTSVGLSFDCSWSRYGYSGGVIDRKDVVALRDYLTHLLDEADRQRAQAAMPNAESLAHLVEASPPITEWDTEAM